MNENIFKFTLNNTIEGPLVISEPDGWKDATLKLERDKEYHSIVEFYDQVFTFYGSPSEKYDGGYEYIKNIMTTQGPDADVMVLVEISEDSGATYETLFSGLIKLSEVIEIDFYKIQCGIIRDDFWSKFWNQRGTSIDVQSPTDIYGDARPVLNTIIENLTGQKIPQLYEGHGDQGTTITYVIPPGEYGQIDFAQEILSEIKEKFTLSRVENADRPTELFAPIFSGDYVFNAALYFYGTGVFAVPIDPGIKLRIQVNDDSPIDFTNTTESGGLDSWTKLSYSGTITLAAKDLVRIYLINTTGGSLTINWYANVLHDSYLNVTGYTEFPDSTAETMLIHETTQSVLDRIIGQDDSFYSEYFGNTNTQRITYADDGCFSYCSLSKGLHKKGYTFADKPFAISFDQIWKGANPIFNLGLGYETIGGNQVIRIEPKSHFYDSSVSINLDFVNKIEHSYSLSNIFKNIKIGYQKWESENVSGLDEVQTKHEYALPLKKIGEEIELYSQFIGAALAQEFTRRQSVEKTKDYRLDNDVFITHLLKDGSDYLPYTSDNGGSTMSGSNIDFPESRYNLLITVARNFYRWLDFLNGGAQFNTDFLFQNGEGNISATIDDGNPTCGFEELTENDNVPVTSDILFGIDVYTFEHPLSWNEYKTIRDNSKKAIGISRTDSGHQAFFIMSLEWNPVTPKGKFIVIANE